MALLIGPFYDLREILFTESFELLDDLNDLVGHNAQRARTFSPDQDLIRDGGARPVAQRVRGVKQILQFVHFSIVVAVCPAFPTISTVLWTVLQV